MKRRIPSWVLGAAVFVCPAYAWAEDPAAAEALFKDAVAKYKEGKFVEACPAFAESQRLDPRPGTLFALAECEAAADHIATAATLYEDFLRTVAGIEDKTLQTKYLARVTRAQARKAELFPELPKLTLVLPMGARSDVRIAYDGEPLNTTWLGMERPVNPGEHIVTVQLASGMIREQRIRLGRGESKTLVLDVPKTPVAHSSERIVPYENLPPERKQATAKPGQSPALRNAGFVVGGIGLGGVIAGVIAGGVILRQKPIITGNCPNLLCNPIGMAAVDRLPALDVVNAVGLALGGVATVSGAIMVGASRHVSRDKLSRSFVQWIPFVEGSRDLVVGVKGAF